MVLVRISIILLLTLCLVTAKIYQRCELARELRNFDMPEDEIPTWVCIAQHESDFDTGAVNLVSGDHGLFQISQIYWCSPPGEGYGCNSPCSKFQDDDIADDLQCIRRIYNEHRRISGNGFDAWVVYPLFCNGSNFLYIKDCFDEVSQFAPTLPGNVTDNEISTDVDQYGDGYHFPPLPSIPKKYDDRYEFPKLPYSKLSIHHVVSSQSSSDTSSQRFSKVLDKQIYNVPFSKTSIDDFVPSEEKTAPNETPLQRFLSVIDRNIHKLPFSRTSIHDFVSLEEKLKQIPKFPFSKTSIHHSIPAKASEETICHFVSLSIETDGELPSEVKRQEQYRSAHSKQSINKKPLCADFKTVSKASETPTSSTSTIRSYTTPTPIIPTIFSSKTIKPTSAPYSLPAATTTKASTVSYTGTTTRPQSVQVFNTFSSTTTKPFTTTTILSVKFNTNSNTSPYSSSKHIISTSNPFKIDTSYYSTTSPTLSNDITVSTYTPFKTTLKAFTDTITTPKPYLSSPSNQIQVTTTKRYERPHLKDTRSTFNPTRTNYEISTTSPKPLTSTPTQSYKFATKKASISTRFGFDQLITTTKPSSSIFSFRPFTTTAPITHFSKHTTISAVANTTPQPSDRQLTFAPDSFFSWLFNTQTLPPILPPVRPPRPPGERPTGLPRPPGGPQPPATTKRPFRPSRPQQRPFSSRHTTRRPLRPYSKEDDDHFTSVAPTERSQNFNKTGVEVKLDGNVVFVRTNYGYRMYRT